LLKISSLVTLTSIVFFLNVKVNDQKVKTIKEIFWIFI
jgi:hypothetical protein